MLQVVALAQDSSSGVGFNLGALFGGGGEDPAIKDPKREAALAASRIPCTIVRCPAVKDQPGGRSNLKFSKAAKGSITREDLATVVAQAAQQKAPKGSRKFAVAAGKKGSLPSNWKEVFASL